MYKVNSITYNALQNEDILLAKKNSKQNEYKYGCCADRHKKKAKTRTKTTNSRIRGNKRFRTILFIVSGHTHDYIFAFYVKEIT